MKNKTQKIISWLKFYFIPSEENHYEPQILKGRFLFVFVIILIGLKLLILPTFYFLEKTDFYAAVNREMLLSLINEERSKNNLPPLRENESLNKAAELKANNMLAEGYFSHTSPSGISPWHWFSEAGYKYWIAGENLAIGFLEATEVFDGWKNSPSHLANLLNPKFEEVGIAVVKGNFKGKETTIVVQELGAPKIQQTQAVAQKSQPTPIPQNQNIPPSPVPAIEKPVQTPSLTAEPTFASPSPSSAPAESSFPSASPIASPISTPKPILASSPSPSPQVAARTNTVSGSPQKPAESLYSKEVAGEKTEEGTVFGFWKFMVENYYDLIQKIIFFALAFMVVILLINVFVKINVQRPALILKTLIFIGMLVGFSLVNKNLMLQIIPHNIMIF